MMKIEETIFDVTVIPKQNPQTHHSILENENHCFYVLESTIYCT